MASLLFGAIVLTYDAIAKSLRRRRAVKADRDARFATLERDNAARIARLRERCDCGGDHIVADHPGGPYVRDELGDGGDERVIRNDEGSGIGVYTTGRDEGPPAYDEVLAEGRGTGRGGWDERDGYVR